MDKLLEEVENMAQVIKDGGAIKKWKHAYKIAALIQKNRISDEHLKEIAPSIYSLTP